MSGKKQGDPGRDFPAEGDNHLMFYARRAGSHREIFNLVAEGHDIAARDDLERCPLILATVSVDVRNVLVLIRKGADLKSVDAGGDTPLHWAVHHKNAEVARLLLKKGADMTARNEKGQTPLCVALEQNDAVMMATFDWFKNKQVTDAFNKGTVDTLVVRSPLTFKPHAKMKTKPRRQP